MQDTEEPGKHAKLKKQVTKSHSYYMKCPELINPERQEAN
jgi:hypothetical protein